MTYNYTHQLVPNLKATVHQREFFLGFFFLNNMVIKKQHKRDSFLTEI